MSTLTLVFEDGRVVKIPASEKQTVYLAALMKKVRLQSDCLEGTCGTCKARCTQGSYTQDEYLEEALSGEEAASGYVLTCQMHAISDCVIEFDYPSGLAYSAPPVAQTARVSEVGMVSSTVARLVVKPEGNVEQVSFIPGQYVHLGVPGTGENRSYSFANPPERSDSFEFYIKVLPQGAMSDYVRDRARVGDQIAVTGPFGRFYLRTPELPILMVAGGTGLAPMLSMLDHLAAAGGTDQPVHLLYGANDPAELFALDQLDSYRAKGIKLTVEPVVVAANGDWSGKKGFVTDFLRPELIHGGNCDVYLCGPPPMIDAAERWLADAGVSDHRVHAEKFVAS